MCLVIPEVRIIDLTPEVRVVNFPPEGRVDAVSPVTPPGSARMSPCSSPVVSFDQSAVSSMAISPNRVRLDNSPDIPAAEPVFEVSPDTSGLLMRPSGAAVQAPVSCLPLQPGLDSNCDPVLGDPVAFTLSGTIPGSDALPMTFPIYPLPSELALLPGQSSDQTILASAVSSRLCLQRHGASGSTVYGRDGIMASSDGSGRSRACAGFVLQCVHELSVLFSGGASFFRRVTAYILVLPGRHS